MKKLTYLLALTYLVLAQSASAQETLFAVNYATAVPLGNTKEFNKDFSWRGMSFEYHYFAGDNFGISFDGGWQYMNEVIEKTTYTFDNLAVTGKQYRYTKCVPLILGLTYVPMPEAMVKPYAVLGLGTIYTERRNEVSVYSIYTDAWQFAIKPELGVAVELSANTLFKLSAKYHYGFQSNDMDAQSFLGIHAGLAFTVE